MFGIGSTELLVILLVALIVLGPKSLASVSRSLGKAMGEFRRVSTDFQRTLNVEAAREEAKEKETALKRSGTRPDEQAGGQRESAGQESVEPAGEFPDRERESGFAGIPADSPIAKAVAKAKNEAAGTTGPDSKK